MSKNQDFDRTILWTALNRAAPMDPKGYLYITVEPSMGARKEQHFVPKFYMKFFASNLEGTEIGIYNLHNKKFYYHAPLKSQAKVKLLYGDDDVIENWLSIQEGKWATILKNTIDTESLPDISSVEYIQLLRHILIQYCRTPQRAIEVNEMNSELDIPAMLVLRQFRWNILYINNFVTR